MSKHIVFVPDLAGRYLLLDEDARDRLLDLDGLPPDVVRRLAGTYRVTRIDLDQMMTAIGVVRARRETGASAAGAAPAPERDVIVCDNRGPEDLDP